MDFIGPAFDPDRQAVLSGANSARDGVWRKMHVTYGQIVESLLARRAGTKDGACILQGELRGHERKKNLVLRQHVVMFDHDTGVPFADVVKRYEDLGLYHVVWATHSHMKDTTSIGETTLERYRQRLGVPAINDALIEKYLREEKFYESTILENGISTERDVGANGVEFIVTHEKMSRTRALVFLDQPFEIANHETESGYTPQQQRLKDWAQHYIGFGVVLGFPVDVSCTDTSRLMYLPSYPEGAHAADYPIHVSEKGALLRLESVPKHTIKDISRVKAEGRYDVDVDGFSGGTEHRKYETRGLLKFLRHAKTFQIADFVRDYLDSEIKPNGDQGEKVTLTCPNDGAHSDAGNEDDRGFFVQNGDGVTGFAAHCQHATCKMESDGDRAFFLDGLCVMAGITDASELTPYVLDVDEPTAEETEEREEEIQCLTKDSSVEEVRAALRELAREGDPLTVAREIKTIARNTELPVAELRAQFRDMVVDEEGAMVARPPDDPDNYEGPIFIEWDAHVAARIVKAQMERRNREKAEFFLQPPYGDVVRLVADDYAPSGLRVTHVGQSKAVWRNILLNSVKFVSLENPQLGIHPPENFVSTVAGESQWKFNILERIVNVPQLGPDMQLHFTEGYKPDIRCYMRPNVRIPELPDLDDSEEVWADEVADSIQVLLEEGVRDFPFADYGDDFQKDIKLVDKDADGWNLPNLSRGKGSRINWLAMVLQGFIRPAINGPCPAYHIDKSAPGTGAGYLVRTAYYILTGGPESVISPSRNEEEFNKMITAALGTGSQFLFLDNINHKMDSASLATALTSGKWEGRKLGKSEVLNLPIRCIWVMAGNSLTFTEELLRRNVPIMMDAKTANPARDRGEGDFKHHPMETWLVEQRPALVRACLILVLNWLRKGHADGKANMNSFTHWAKALSGIFEAADETMMQSFDWSYKLAESFLVNVPEYLGAHVDEHVTEGSLAELLYSTYGTEPMTISDVVAVIQNPEYRNMEMGIEVRGIDDAGVARSAGSQLGRHFVNRTFDIHNKKFQMRRGRSTGGRYYQFVLVTGN